jgi:hypothetical protein
VSLRASLSWEAARVTDASDDERGVSAAESGELLKPRPQRMQTQRIGETVRGAVLSKRERSNGAVRFVCFRGQHDPVSTPFTRRV